MKLELKRILKTYIALFEKKHDLFFEFAVGGNYLGVLCFGCVYYFSMDDIVFDIDTNQPPGLIVEWLEQSLEYTDEQISFRSYSKGARFNVLTKESEVVLKSFLKSSRI